MATSDFHLRARLAAEYLKAHGFDPCLILADNIDEWGYFQFSPAYRTIEWTEWPDEEIGQHVMEILRGEHD